MSLYSRYKTDPKKEIEGVEIKLDDAPNEDGSIPTFKIARIGGGNKLWQEVYAKAWAPYRELAEAKKVPDALSDKITREVFVDACLKSWENVPDEKGQLIENGNREGILKLFEDLPEVHDVLHIKSNTRSLYLAEQTKIAAGN